ncbi:Asp-tRNA(Asn)/Glu-tRNA(Gln) amidotransferase subunit GatC [Euzebya tangerina]|uniref:Asp-tRNA(Asn)/Glu-tRNA(Gln) amidotransferase subunit GatC n=1 Tax=Euzebya tangerina TaxID=591198 RepID=UPI000E3135EE|nr:Asp-tRNA(Asn)/Glu-tRNA(Gln) amidotransferase subunit GatC [Euzebya tangerina]
MALSEDDVRHVANLAQLALTDEEVQGLVPQLAEILAYAEKVGEVAVSEVPPTSHAYPLKNVFRSDEEVGEPLPPEEVIANAPAEQDTQFRVPRIVGEGGSEGGAAPLGQQSVGERQ